MLKIDMSLSNPESPRRTLLQTRIVLAGSDAWFANVDLHAQARRSGHVNQGVEAEQVDLATREVRDPRLGHPKNFGGLRLGEMRARNILLERCHERCA